MLLSRAAWLAAACATALGCGSGSSPPHPPSRHLVRLTSGNPGAGFFPLGEALARGYASTAPTIDVRVLESSGAVHNVQAIDRGDADIGFAFADVAYMAYTGRLQEAPGSHQQLRGIAVLQLTPLHLVIRRGLDLVSPAQLRGLRVAFGPPGSGTALTAGIVTRAYGLDARDMQAERLPFGEAGRRLAAGTIDAAFFDVSYPAESIAMATRAGSRLVPLDGPAIDRLRRDNPFLRPTFVPGGTYPGHPTHTPTLGIDSILLCHADLDDGLVYTLTRGLFEMLPVISAERASLRDMEIGQAPATSVPLHRGAARYYRERELTR